MRPKNLSTQSVACSTRLRRPNMTLALSALFVAAVLLVQTAAQAATCPPILDQRFTRLQDGKSADLCEYAGKVVLVVNTASFCGFTRQYEGLEKLFADYRDRGLVVLGFPANDFANQEPGTDKEIANFCRLTYGVAFPMFGKSHVVGARVNPFYKALAARTGQSPAWNFHKYLISRDGKEVLSFGSAVAPDSVELMTQIDRFLNAGVKS